MVDITARLAECSKITTCDMWNTVQDLCVFVSIRGIHDQRPLCSAQSIMFNLDVGLVKNNEATLNY